MDATGALGVAKRIYLKHRTTSLVMQTLRLLPESQTYRAFLKGRDIEVVLGFG